MEIKITYGPDPDDPSDTWSGFHVEHDGKIAGPLTWDEMIGTVTSISMPSSRPCLHWLETPEQRKAKNLQNVPLPPLPNDEEF